MMQAVKSVVPASLRREFHLASYALRVYAGLRGRTIRACPICGSNGRFSAAGDPPRFDVCCPQCSSLDRHRLLFLACRDLNLVSGGSVLHFAPEPNVASFLKPIAERYVSADIIEGRADLALNMEETGLPDGSFDWIVASHVLEHVDDRRALPEMHRILKAGGAAVIMVPIVEGWDATYENEKVHDEEGRRLHFGQDDHVRMYGRDLRTRIRDAGFTLEEYVASPQACVEFGLCRGERVFVCRKKA